MSPTFVQGYNFVKMKLNLNLSWQIYLLNRSISKHLEKCYIPFLELWKAWFSGHYSKGIFQAKWVIIGVDSHWRTAIFTHQTGPFQPPLRLRQRYHSPQEHFCVTLHSSPQWLHLRLPWNFHEGKQKNENLYSSLIHLSYLIAISSGRVISLIMKIIPPCRRQQLKLGMGQYEKYGHREVANAKLHRFWDYAFLVPPKQTWTFPLHDMSIKVAKWTEYEINAYNFLRFLICSQYFKFSFNYMSWQARLRIWTVITETWPFCST